MYEENHPKVSRGILKKSLNEFWVSQLDNQFANPVRDLIRTITGVDRKLRNLSYLTDLKCTVSMMTVLIYKRTALVYCAGDSKLLLLSKKGPVDFSEEFHEKPLGELDINSDIVKGHFRIEDGMKLFLMTRGIYRHLNFKEFFELREYELKTICNLLYLEAVKKGRKNCSLASTDYEKI